jgi:hypothetical protein
VSLSFDLLSRFAKITKDDTKVEKESTVYGTTVEYNGTTWVRLDGSDLLTPVSTTADVKAGERVTVMIKNHTATVTGNISSPAARTGDLKDAVDQISEFEIIIAHKVSADEIVAINATIESLRAKTAKFDNIEAVNAEIDSIKASLVDTERLTATDIEAVNAQLEHLEATFGEFTDISTDELDAIYADIGHLKAYTADFTYVSTEVLEAMKASIKTLDTEKLSTKSAEIKYANIDFTNIGEAAIRKIFSDTGLIKDLIVGDTTITGELVGVTLKGDLIEANTLKADRLVVKGSDGIYYKLNFEAGTFKDGEAVPTDGLHGSVITAKSIAAEKVNVTDLVAFGATIGGFTIKDHSLYSGVKESATNTTRGVFLGDDGQVGFGDANNFIRYYKDDNGLYRLEIAAGSILLSTSNKSVDDVVNELEERVSKIRIGARNHIRNSNNLLFTDYYFANIDELITAIVGQAIVGSAIVGKG